LDDLALVHSVRMSCCDPDHVLQVFLKIHTAFIT